MKTIPVQNLLGSLFLLVSAVLAAKSTTYPGSICHSIFDQSTDDTFDLSHGRMNSKVDYLQVNCPLPLTWDFALTSNDELQNATTNLTARVYFRNLSYSIKNFGCILEIRDIDSTRVTGDYQSISLRGNKLVDFHVSWERDGTDLLGDIAVFHCTLPGYSAIQSIPLVQE